jgi:hypothetical protein
MGALTRWEPIAVLNVKGQRIHILSLAGLPALDVDVQEATRIRELDERLVETVGASRRTRGATLLFVDLHGGAQGLWSQAGALDVSGISSPDGRRLAIWVRSRSANLWLAELR